MDDNVKQLRLKVTHSKAKKITLETFSEQLRRRSPGLSNLSKRWQTVDDIVPNLHNHKTKDQAYRSGYEGR